MHHHSHLVCLLNNLDVEMITEIKLEPLLSPLGVSAVTLCLALGDVFFKKQNRDEVVATV